MPDNPRALEAAACRDASAAIHNHVNLLRPLQTSLDDTKVTCELLDAAAKRLYRDDKRMIRLANRVMSWKHKKGGKKKRWCECKCERHSKPMCGMCMAYDDAARKVAEIIR